MVANPLLQNHAGQPQTPASTTSPLLQIQTGIPHGSLTPQAAQGTKAQQGGGEGSHGLGEGGQIQASAVSPASLPPAFVPQEQKGAQWESQRRAQALEPREKGKAGGLTCRSWAEATVRGVFIVPEACAQTSLGRHTGCPH